MPSLTGVWRLLSGNTSTSSPQLSSAIARTAARPSQEAHSGHSSSLGLLTLGAIGVVYGDIGTSPLYALRECFHGQHGIAPTHDNVLGVLSLIFWSLTLIISIKYILFVMRADNNGEGGILALLALVAQSPDAKKKSRASLIALGLFGAALLYGDGMITPAISVLGAVEGLEVVTHIFEPYIVPITLVILVALFMIQSHGTTRVGMLFGPVMVVWFITIAVLGLTWIVKEPGVLAAFNPLHALTFFRANGWHGFVVLGAVFLVVTGGEALYADMGHFGPKPIRLAWFSIVLPALFLNYLGQGAMILLNPAAASSPFYLMAPRWGLLALVVLATLAAIIASQALISGAFSLTRQAIQLGYSPRLDIEYTSEHHQGQIYISQVNWALMFATLGLVVGFQSSSALAAAYGIAVTLTMLITTMLAYLVARGAWGVRRVVAGSIALFFFLIEFSFFGANLLKVMHGGWFPLVVGAVVYTILSTWKSGRALLASRMREKLYPFDRFLQDIEAFPPQRVTGTAVFMTSNLTGTPPTLLHNLQHNKVLHERVILLTVVTSDTPYVAPDKRTLVEPLGHGFYRLTVRYGFMEEPDVPEALSQASVHGFQIDLNETTFFLGLETLLATRRPGLPLWRERLFVLISRNAVRANAFFKIPPERVVELGMQVEL
ncbi:MAG TPA: potassium transporter Kup [Vicinamibacterales bacterium]|nr:potassium transporter Kup [Vicinamibacterales bacterium]